MSVPFYARPSLHVEAYDTLHAAVPGGEDLAFITELARETGGPLLVLGCGTGRLTIPLASGGFDVVGLDRSSAMLEVARAKSAALDPDSRRRLGLVEADMTSFELDRPFGLVFAVFRVFMALLDPEAQLAALTTAFRHLAPGGRLVIDLFDPRLDALVPGTHAISRLVTGRLASGSVVEAGPFERTCDMVRQVFVERWRFVERDPAGREIRVEEEVLSLRWTYRYEMRHLLALAGFEVEAEYGDYAGGPPTYAAEQIWVARRREGRA